MSIERLFISRNNMRTYRISPSIKPGETHIVTDISDGAKTLIIASCLHQDEGGLVSEINVDGLVGPDGEELENPSEDFVEVEGIELEPGAIYKRHITLTDGDEGIIFIQHNVSGHTSLN